MCQCHQITPLSTLGAQAGILELAHGPIQVLQIKDQIRTSCFQSQSSSILFVLWEYGSIPSYLVHLMGIHHCLHVVYAEQSMLRGELKKFSVKKVKLQHDPFT